MKNNNHKNTNFFEPKVNVNIDYDEIFIRKKFLKISLKIYSVVACVTIIYLVFKTIMINYEYNSTQKAIEKMIQQNTTTNNLKKAIQEDTILKNIFSEYSENNKISASILEDIDNTILNQLYIEEIDWALNNIKLTCSSVSEKDAITFTNKLRQNEKFKDVLYTGGVMGTNNSFKFEINILI